jgi:hypothetical protein
LLPVDSLPQVVAAALSSQFLEQPLSESVTRSVPTWKASAGLLATAYEEVLEFNRSAVAG